MKTIISIVATLALVGCGSSDSSTGDNVDNGTSPSESSYSAYVPLVNNPSTYICSTTQAEGFDVGIYATSQSECDTKAQAWLNDFNHEDTPRTQEQVEALTWINYVRAGAGLPIFKHNAKLEQATANHENYLGDVVGTYNVDTGHYEDNSNYPSEYYTGAEGTDRAEYAGYDGYWAGDVISYQRNGTTTTSMVELTTAIYHRQAMLWNWTNEIGIGGVERNHSFKTQPHLMGAKEERRNFLQALSSVAVIYPFNGQTEVETTFRGENPDPLPNHADGTGNPISITFNASKVSEVEMLSFKLYEDATNAEVTNVTYMDKVTDPNDRFSNLDFALFPMDVLKTSTLYRVEINYVLDGEELSKSWTFETRG